MCAGEDIEIIYIFKCTEKCLLHNHNHNIYLKGERETQKSWERVVMYISDQNCFKYKTMTGPPRVYILKAKNKRNVKLGGFTMHLILELQFLNYLMITDF